MGDNASAPFLEVEDLQIEFRDHSRPETAVHDFDLVIRPGEIVGIVGESGAGKSLSALAIAGLLKRRSEVKRGRIVFDGEDLLHCGRDVLRRYQGNEIAVIFQEPMTSLNPVMRVGAQVEECLLVHHPEIGREERRARALQALEDAGLSDSERVYRSYPHQLSGGMRQRVMIAAAMIGEPRLLIADEPTTALDVTVQAQIIELLRSINRSRNTAILFISHDLSLVRQLCERIVVMKDGRIVEEGPAEQVFLHPAAAYTEELIAAIPRVEKKASSGEMMRDREPILVVSHLEAGYGRGSLFRGGKNRVLRDVSFSLREGEVLGLAGESGSGKSTLARTLMGLLQPLSGTVERRARDGAFRTAMVFQDPYGSLNPAHTVEWILTEALCGGKRRRYPAAELRAIAADALEQVELSESFLERRPEELSGGQRQRVAIAEALIGDPQLLIADEPVSALDVTVQAQIIRVLERLRRERRISILLISHDLRVIYRICDRLLILRRGTVVETGEVQDVYFNPKKEYTRMLLAAAGIRCSP